MEAGIMLNQRYRILRKLGASNIGLTYLVEDTHRFNENCVVKELVPQVQTPQERQKIEELFEREAKVLYKLQHPQIPRFREIFREGAILFLVQDYIHGQTYGDLLKIRQIQGLTFTEREVTQLLTDILPVLAYIHARGIIHRNICPDNLILRHSDQLPVLIDFGTVKQINPVGITPHSQPITVALAIQLGQMGYAPPEQIHSGLVFPHSDLYALAVTVLVLLTGWESEQLINPNLAPEPWTQKLNLSPHLTRILMKMLAKNPSDRFLSAQEVLAALNESEEQIASAVKIEQENQATVVPDPIIASVSSFQASHPANSPEINSPVTDSTMTSTATRNNNFLAGCLGKLLIVLMLSLGSGMLGWFAGKIWLSKMTQNTSDLLENEITETSSKISDREWKRKNEIQNRRVKLGINNQIFYQLVEQIFVSKYPSQQGRILTNKSEDAQWREKWDEISADLLDKLGKLSPAAIEGLGKYNQQQRDRWKLEVNQLYLSSRALYDLADAQFFSYFPEQENQDFIEQPLGQIWNALILEKLQALQSGDIYEQITIPEEGLDTQLEGTLESGEGRAYVAKLNSSQSMEIKVNTEQNTWLSIYSPSGKNNLLEDSKEKQWSGILPEDGYYEFVIVSRSNKTLQYQINIKINNQ